MLDSEYATMTVGRTAGLSSPKACRISEATARIKGRTSISMAPRAPGKREPPEVMTTWQIKELVERSAMAPGKRHGVARWSGLAFLSRTS